jgi:2-keto-4-pentenoate hydratase
MKPKSSIGSAADTALRDVAARFVAARRACRPLAEFPGTVPPDLETAYRIQDHAIALWDGPVRGWKVGRIPPEIEDLFGIDRLAGPIFATTIHASAGGDGLAMPVFDGGFAAVEAEYVAVISADAPAGKLEYSTGEAAAMIAELRIGLEVASSPLGRINDLGPAVVVSDFGNNAGLIVGPPVANWRSRSLESLRCDAYVDGKAVGHGGAFRLTGGFIRSVQFLLEMTARRGRPLKAGDLVATGQTTGIHDVAPGQTSRLDFASDGQLGCSFTAAQPGT